MQITALLPAHWSAVKTIYEAGLATGNASFQTSAPSWEDWDTAHLAHSRLVALDGDVVAGWAALTPVSGRCVYAGVAEVSIYVDDSYRGQGVGKALLQALITESEARGIWTLQAGIFPENTASLRLHEWAGFRRVGVREKIGKIGDRWRDTVLLEKRSKTVGL
ncbi:GNAT family N-acetyltransferase [Puia dinghuensis]|uniref:Phosphinothricin N-acetyltransferase n=1 Tax=Puia dinghuensis TaxID=1792502 RepID=A0A8J2UIB4_9BACT|nr:GNAT family N-acetyltransferase [Puia dinghuensis]GGB21052.1 phosphinothricin N-acetyltransferase [Puia dinghuensis]